MKCMKKKSVTRKTANESSAHVCDEVTSRPTNSAERSTSRRWMRPFQCSDDLKKGSMSKAWCMVSLYHVGIRLNAPLESPFLAALWCCWRFCFFVEQMTKRKGRIRRSCVKSSAANIESKNTVAKVSRRQQCILLDSSSKHENWDRLVTLLRWNKAPMRRSKDFSWVALTHGYRDFSRWILKLEEEMKMVWSSVFDSLHV